MNILYFLGGYVGGFIMFNGIISKNYYLISLGIFIIGVLLILSL